MSVRSPGAPRASASTPQRRRATLLAPGFAWFLCLWASPAVARSAQPEVSLRFCRQTCGEPYRLRVADTPRAQAQGLMGVTHLPPRGGMLFVFKRPEQRVFWMKNTPLALDLIFVGANCRIVGTVAGAVPFTETERSVAGASQYVVELAAGSAAAADLQPGDRVEFVAAAGRCSPVAVPAPAPEPTREIVPHAPQGPVGAP